MEIIQNIHKVVVGDNNNNVYLITGKDSAVFFDSGDNLEQHTTSILELWIATNKPEIAGIIISHRHGDHSGGAAKLAELTGAPIITSEAEKKSVEKISPETQVTRVAADGELLDLGGITLEFILTPGHTVGSLSTYCKENYFLLAGDSIRNNGQLFKVDANAGDLNLHLESLQKLLNYDIHMIGPGHGTEVRNPRTHIENELLRLSDQSQ